MQYTNPAAYPPLEHSSRILADSRWRVIFLGTGALGAAALRFRPHRNITVRQMRFCGAGWRQKLHYAAFCAWVLGWTIAWRPKWIYASDPLSSPIALLLSWLPGIRIIYHEHDSPSTEDVGSWFGKFTLWARRRLAVRTMCCVLPNQERATRFHATVGHLRHVFCVWNCPAKEEASAARPPLNDNGLWLLYHGSIVPSRLPLTVLEAMALLPDCVKLRIIGYETVGHRGYLKTLKAKACELGIADRIEAIGSVPSRAELLESCRRSDVGFALLPHQSRDINEQTMVGASNKPFDYLACGLALLTSNRPDWRATYADPRYGLTCDPEDSASIATAVRCLMDHPGELRTMGERGRQRILNDWNYETQFQSVARVLNG